jgi:hypothetical protein
MNEITAFQATTLAIACVGAVLGVINTWRAINNDRVKLQVKPVWRIHPDGKSFIAIEVINRSSFAVTINFVGFNLWFTRSHLPVLSNFGFGNALPHKLEARTSAIFYLIASTTEDKRLSRVKSAYVRTACGLKFNGSNAALRGFVNEKASAS